MSAGRRLPVRDLVALTVLVFLAEQPRHPYDVQRVIRERHKTFAQDRPRAVYRAFEALTQAGLIEPMETNREGKRPERTVYQITADGREELETWLSELLEILLFDHSTFGAAVNYLCYISADVAINALQGRVVHLEGEIAALRATLRSLRGQMGLPRLFVLKPEYDLALREAELAWVQALLSDLRSGTLAWDPARLGRVFEEKRSDAD